MKSDQFFLSNEKDVRPPPAKKRKQYAGVYQADWGRMFEGMIAPSKLGEHYAWCVPCSRDIKVHVYQTGGNRHAGLRDHGRGYVFLFRG